MTSNIPIAHARRSNRVQYTLRQVCISGFLLHTNVELEDLESIHHRAKRAEHTGETEEFHGHRKRL